MQKAHAIELLGGDVKAAAQALECDPSTIHRWPEKLPRMVADRVIGARVRLEWGQALRHLTLSERKRAVAQLPETARFALGLGQE